MITRYLEVKNIIEDIISFVDYRNISVPQVKKIASDFARKIETDEQLTHRVYWAPVVDHVVDMPIDVNTILQVSYKEGKKDRPKTKMQIVEWSQRAFDDSNCKYKITLDCPKCHEENCSHTGAYVTINADDIWRQQHPEYPNIARRSEPDDRRTPSDDHDPAPWSHSPQCGHRVHRPPPSGSAP